MRKKSRNESVRAADIVSALGSVTKEKSISVDLVLDTLKDALASGARRVVDGPAHIEVGIEREKGTIEVFTRQTVVEEVEDPEMEIALKEARTLDPELEIGDELIQDLDIELFGRTAIQTAKQVILQRVREAERSKIFEDYGERIGELITGTVQQIDKGNILVNLGRTEALLPWREQIRKERYRQGDTIRGVIADVKNNLKGPQVIISRTSPEFLARLFELEVPEIFDGTVKIVKVVRDPGHRSKIAVASGDSRVDPVGACVGMRGNRVQAIVRELSNERIDIINWTEEITLLVRRVFSPAEVRKIVEVSERKLVVIVGEEDLAQAIGREGQNIRLASKMADKEIDIYGDAEFAALSEEERDAILSRREDPPADDAPADEGEDEGVVAMNGEGSVDDEAAAQEALDADGQGDGNAADADPADDDDANADDDADAANDPVAAIVEKAVDELAGSEQGLDEAIGGGEEKEG